MGFPQLFPSSPQLFYKNLQRSTTNAKAPKLKNADNYLKKIFEFNNTT